MDAIRKKMQSLKAETDGNDDDNKDDNADDDVEEDVNDDVLQACTPPSRSSRIPPRNTTDSLSRPTVISETSERKSRTLRLDSMRPTTN